MVRGGTNGDGGTRRLPDFMRAIVGFGTIRQTTTAAGLSTQPRPFAVVPLSAEAVWKVAGLVVSDIGPEVVDGGYVEGVDRGQATFLPDRLDDFVDADNPVRVVDAFADALDLRGLGFVRAVPSSTGRPGYHPAVLLKLYIYGYLNRIPFERRLEREAARNFELMWLTGRLVPDHKTMPTSGATMAKQSAGCAAGSCFSARAWACSVRR